MTIVATNSRGRTGSQKIGCNTRDFAARPSPTTIYYLKVFFKTAEVWGVRRRTWDVPFLQGPRANSVWFCGPGAAGNMGHMWVLRSSI